MVFGNNDNCKLRNLTIFYLKIKTLLRTLYNDCYIELFAIPSLTIAFLSELMRVTFPVTTCTGKVFKID